MIPKHFDAVPKQANSNVFVAKFEFATASTTTLTSNGTPEKLGAKVTFTADLTGEALTGPPTGTVDFIVDGGSAAAETLDDTGHAMYSTTTLAEGVHKVIARYLGDATHLASTSNTVTETIYGVASAETIVSGSPQTVNLGATSAPLVVIVKDAKGDVVPGVLVTFSGSDVKLSSTIAITGANGEPFITVVPSAVGMLTVKAVAAGITTAVSFTIAGNLGTASQPVVSKTITSMDIKNVSPDVEAYINAQISEGVQANAEEALEDAVRQMRQADEERLARLIKALLKGEQGVGTCYTRELMHGIAEAARKEMWSHELMDPDVVGD